MPLTDARLAVIAPALLVPTVSLHGTSRDALAEQSVAVCEAVGVLRAALVQAGPNARDYPDQDTYGRARATHAASLQSLAMIESHHTRVLESLFAGVR